MEASVNDFAQDLTGCQGIMKKTAFFKPKASEKERTFTILSGAGCLPTVNTRRQIHVKWLMMAPPIACSYDLETLITRDGKRLQAEPVFIDFDRATVPGDIKETKTDKPRTVRRKA